MQIPVVAGIGQGRTRRAAFNSALNDCGVLAFNLIDAGSAIPPGSIVFESDRVCPSAHEHGDRLYAVAAERRSRLSGRAIAAGIGWFQWQGGRGIFAGCDAEGDSTVAAEAEVLDRINESLRDLSELHGVPFHRLRTGCRLASTEVGPEPAAVVVLALLGSERW